MPLLNYGPKFIENHKNKIDPIEQIRRTKLLGEIRNGGDCKLHPLTLGFRPLQFPVVT